MTRVLAVDIGTSSARAQLYGDGAEPLGPPLARLHYRGHPNKELHRFAVEGAPPAPGTPIFQNAKQVGKMTSIAPLPTDGRYLALGYLSRNADTQGVLHAGKAVLRFGR